MPKRLFEKGLQSFNNNTNTAKKFNDLLNAENPVNEYLNNIYLYNQLLLSLNPDKQQGIFNFLYKNFVKNNCLKQFYFNMPLEILEKHIDNIIKNKDIEFIKNNNKELFFDLFYQKYFIEIDYIDLLNFIYDNYKNLSISYKIKSFLMLLHYSSIEYSKDKKMGYTRINFNNLFTVEKKHFFLKELVNIYNIVKKNTKEKILDYLIILKDFIYIHSDIFFEIISLISKKNLEIYSTDSQLNEFVNVNYYLTLYLLSITTFKELNIYLNNEKEYNKQLTILFLKNGILLEELCKTDKSLSDKHFFKEEFEILYLIKNINSNKINFKKNQIIFNLVNEIINLYKKNKKLISINNEDIEYNIPNFSKWLEIFWKKEELEQFFENNLDIFNENLKNEKFTVYNLLIKL